MQELRCDNGILFGVLHGRLLEVSCRSRRCGKEPGVVIIHRYRLQIDPEGRVTGDLVDTSKTRDPAYRKETDHGAGRQPAVRSA